jgi:hypothetical protein
MPLGHWNLEFLNHNSQRNYPLALSASRQDLTASLQLPNDFLVSADIGIHPTSGMETTNFFIRQVGIHSSGVQVLIAYDNNGSPLDVAAASIPRTAALYSTHLLTGLVGFESVVGKLVVGKLDAIYAQPAGLFSFDVSGTRFESNIVRPMLRGVSSLRISNAAGTTSRDFYGVIELVAGPNIQLSAAQSGGVSQIVISAISGEGTIESCLCEGESASLPCIRTINGVAADSQGNITLQGDNCITVTPTAGGLKLEDSCCQPCCGCEELEAITRDLERFNLQRTTYETYVTQLSSEIGRMRTSTLGSRLGDRRCITCD